MVKELRWEHTDNSSTAYCDDFPSVWGTAHYKSDAIGHCWRAYWPTRKWDDTTYCSDRKEAIRRINEAYAELQRKQEPVKTHVYYVVVRTINGVEWFDYETMALRRIDALEKAREKNNRCPHFPGITRVTTVKLEEVKE